MARRAETLLTSSPSQRARDARICAHECAGGASKGYAEILVNLITSPVGGDTRAKRAETLLNLITPSEPR